MQIRIYNEQECPMNVVQLYAAHIITNDIHFISANKADSRQINHSSQQVCLNYNWKNRLDLVRFIRIVCGCREKYKGDWI